MVFFAAIIFQRPMNTLLRMVLILSIGNYNREYVSKKKSDIGTSDIRHRFSIHLIYEKYLRAYLGNMGTDMVCYNHAVVYDSLYHCLLPARTKTHPQFYFCIALVYGYLYAID